MSPSPQLIPYLPLPSLCPVVFRSILNGLPAFAPDLPGFTPLRSPAAWSFQSSQNGTALDRTVRFSSSPLRTASGFPSRVEEARTVHLPHPPVSPSAPKALAVHSHFCWIPCSWIPKWPLSSSHFAPSHLPPKGHSDYPV